MTDGFKAPDNKFWMVWVHGSGKPVKRCRSLEDARQDAQNLRADVTKRHVYILECVEMLEGRQVLRLREKRLAQSSEQA